MTRIRRIGAIALATPLAMAFPVFGMLPAEASTGITAPQNGSVITSGSQVTVRARYDLALKMQLRAKTPTGDSFLTSGGLLDHSLSALLSIDRNGRYTVYLKGGVTGKPYASSTFTVRIAPSAPSGVTASVSGRTLKVNWNLGPEDDLTGYSVRASGGAPKVGSVGKWCSGASCSASLPLGSASGTASVQVQARRSNGLGGSVSSPTSLATVAIGGGGGGNGPSTSVPPGTNVPPSGNNGNSNTPLTPFNNQSPVNLPPVQPSDAAPGFTYPTPQVASSQSPKAMNAAASTELQWARSIGIALVLLVVAAHLGTWTRRLRTAQAGVSDKGMAARLARAGSARSRVRNAKQHIAQAEAMAKTAVLPATGAAASAVSAEGTATAGGGSAVPGAGKVPAGGVAAAAGAGKATVGDGAAAAGTSKVTPGGVAAAAGMGKATPGAGKATAGSSAAAAGTSTATAGVASLGAKNAGKKNAGAAGAGVIPPGGGVAPGGPAGADAGAADGGDAPKGQGRASSVVQGAAAKPGPRRSSRRPARLGKRPGGVDVRIADEREDGVSGPLSGESGRKAAVDSPGGLLGSQDETSGVSPVGASSGSTGGSGVKAPAGSPGGLLSSRDETSGASVGASSGSTGDLAAQEGKASGTRTMRQRDIFSIPSAVDGVSEMSESSSNDASAPEDEAKGRRAGRGRRRRK
ncbi:hypothetical protein AB0J52_01680 [Spirillospora sp. NPDC049652]